MNAHRVVRGDRPVDKRKRWAPGVLPNELLERPGFPPEREGAELHGRKIRPTVDRLEHWFLLLGTKKGEPRITTKKALVTHRDENGPFHSRKALLKVTGFGPKTFELSAGFLRVRGGEHPLDPTGVHPERYPVVEQMAKELAVPLKDLVGNPALVAKLDFNRFANDAAGLGKFTLGDIRVELERPGRDPRPEFRTPEWRSDVLSIDDIQVGMVLEGRVSNVANFGAFVDLGVKRDGLVHVSELSQKYVSDPREAVQVGQIVKVKVTEVDRDRGRISLSIKALQTPEARQGRQATGSAGRPGSGPKPQAPAPEPKKSQPSMDDLMRKFNRR